MTRRQMEAKIEELSEELRQLKARQESGHCHGCHCGHVIYYPVTTGTWTYPTTIWSGTTASSGSYQITN